MKKILIIVIPILILLLLVGFRYTKKTEADAASKKLTASRKNAATVVILATAGPKRISQHIDGVATLESPFAVKLSPNIAGRIDYLQVREGDPVHEGQVLIKIDPQQVEAMILQARANVAQARQKLAQAQITQNSTATGIYGSIAQNKALVASTGADYNETAVTYTPTVDAAHEATVDAQNKVQAAEFQAQNVQATVNLAQANLEDAKAKYSRESKLYQGGYAAAQDIDDALASEKVNEATVNAQQKLLNAAQSALVSAQAQEKAAANQEAIARKKGMSDIQDAKAKWTQSKATLDTAVSNRAQIPAYSENLRALSAAVSAAQGSLDQAIAERAFLIVKSPFEGSVTLRSFDPGAEATPGTAILTVNYLKWLYVTAAIPVEDAEVVKPGMDVKLTLDALAGRAFHAKIVDINRAADPTLRQFMIRMKLDNSAGLFKPGMYARITMRSSTVQAAVAVPREAVTVNKKGISSVTVVDGEKVAHVTPVTVGAQDPNNIEILSGVSAGDKVVALSYRPVKDKGKVTESKINVIKRSKPQSSSSTSDPSGGTDSTAPAAPSSHRGRASNGAAQPGG